jgi:KipI family sensor histidine kinase inhibitor
MDAMETLTPLAADPGLRLEALGDRALLAVLGEAIDPEVNDRVHALAGAIRAAGLPGIRDLVPAYATLAVHYQPERWCGSGAAPARALARELQALWAGTAAGAAGTSRVVPIPVRYGGQWGPDLTEVAGHCGLSEAEVVRRHTERDYRVFMLGFAPGFPYLGGLDPALATPRRATPRTRIPAGSVGIAGAQTGIYPLETPGGWQIIGRTDLRLFDPAQPEPCRLRPGDRLRFVAVDPEERP